MKDKKKYLLDEPKNIKSILNIFYGCCVLLLILDLFIHRHVIHSWENIWGFYPLFGFVGCVILVLVATWLRTFLMRDEDYYQKKEEYNNALNKNKEKLINIHTPKKGEHDVDD